MNEHDYWIQRLDMESMIAMQKYEAAKIGLLELQRPCVILKPKLFIDGNMWCALYGENLQEGLAGFGKSPSKALEDFDKNYYKDIEDKEK